MKRIKGVYLKKIIFRQVTDNRKYASLKIINLNINYLNYSIIFAEN